jgi:hypothetical protein
VALTIGDGVEEAVAVTRGGAEEEAITRRRRWCGGGGSHPSREVVRRRWRSPEEEAEQGAGCGWRRWSPAPKVVLVFGEKEEKWKRRRGEGGRGGEEKVEQWKSRRG